MIDLRLRVVALAVFGAVACALFMQLSSAVLVRAFILNRLAHITSTVGEEQLAQCAANPAVWQWDSGLIRVWAYDLNGRSLNAQAPRLEQKVPPKIAPATVFTPGGLRVLPGTSLMRWADSGPCAVLVAKTPQSVPVLAPMLRASALALFFGAIVAGLATAFFSVRPILARLERLDEQAKAVGTSSYQPQGAGVKDSISQIHHTLDQAHERVLREQAAKERELREQESYLANIAHDLRTPLAALQLQLEQLQSEISNPLLNRSQIELAYLSALADNLHQGARLTAGVAKPSACDIGAVVERVAVRFSILGRLRGILVSVALPATSVVANIDPALCERMIANLAHNAVVHGAKDQEVFLVLDSDEHTFTLQVVNSGPPLSDQRLTEFASYHLGHRDESRSRVDGLGVGIINEVVRRCGWKITYQHGPQGGLTVTITGTK